MQNTLSAETADGPDDADLLRSPEKTVAHIAGFLDRHMNADTLFNNFSERDWGWNQEYRARYINRENRGAGVFSMVLTTRMVVQNLLSACTETMRDHGHISLLHEAKSVPLPLEKALLAFLSPYECEIRKMEQRGRKSDDKADVIAVARPAPDEEYMYLFQTSPFAPKMRDVMNEDAAYRFDKQKSLLELEGNDSRQYYEGGLFTRKLEKVYITLGKKFRYQGPFPSSPGHLVTLPQYDFIRSVSEAMDAPNYDAFLKHVLAAEEPTQETHDA